MAFTKKHLQSVSAAVTRLIVPSTIPITPLAMNHDDDGGGGGEEGGSGSEDGIIA